MFFKQQYFVDQTVESGYVEDIPGEPDRVYAQYRNKEKAVRWIALVKELGYQLNSTAQAVRVLYDIDAAEGELLNILGRIVVVPRDFLGYVSLNPGVFSEPDGSEFGDTSAMFSALSIDQDAQMSDALYRIAIKSKIIKNNSFATIEDILFGMNFLLPTAEVLKVIDNEDMSFSIEFYGNIDEITKWALLNGSFVPKPQGVRFNGFLEGYGYVQAGDDSKQFGDTNSQFTGFVGV